MSQPLNFSSAFELPARSRREGRVRTNRFADVQKRPSIFRSGTRIPEDIPGHGFARGKWKSGESCKETGHPSQHVATSNSRVGTGHQNLALGSPSPRLKRTGCSQTENAKSGRNSFFALIVLLSRQSSFLRLFRQSSLDRARLRHEI
jgi:hypothetical protein